jgi:hypothetical protein
MTKMMTMSNEKTPKFRTMKQKIRYYSVKDKVSGCLLWTGGLRDGIYGAVRWKDKTMLAHRFAWEAYYGDMSDNLVIHHTCANSNCVNIKHLQAITQQENVAEMLLRTSYVNKIAELESRLEDCNCEQTKTTGNNT